MTLAALLEELKEVDREAWDEIELSRTPLEEVSWCDLDSDAVVEITKTESVGRIVIESAQYLDIVQGCIQRACERRGWTWLVGKDVYEEGEYRAAISIISESCISDNFDITDIAMEWGDSPAEALLAAYIAAVREEEKR